MNIQVENKQLNARSIVGLFARKTEDLYGIKPKLQWGALCSRVTAMQQREGITWQEYYDFVDKLFPQIFEIGMQPYFGLFVSSKVFHKYKRGFKTFNPHHTVQASKTFNLQELKNWLYNEKYAAYLK